MKNPYTIKQNNTKFCNLYLGYYETNISTIDCYLNSNIYDNKKM
jgi:hypothetical protein